MEKNIEVKIQNKKFSFKQKVSGQHNLGSNSEIAKSLEPVVAVCQKHQSETITNFCSSPKCLIPLCPDCIERHLEDHRGANKAQQEVQSIKASRIKCIQKLQKLSLFINNQMQLLTPPRKLQQILETTFIRMREIKEGILKYVDDYFASFEYDIESRLRSAQQIIQKAEYLHCEIVQKLKKFGDQIQFLKSSNAAIPKKIKQVMEIDSTQENAKFNALVEEYKKNLCKVDMKVVFDEKRFEINFEETIKIHFRGTPDEVVNNINMESNIKYTRTPVIHYFEGGTSNLHIIELPKQNKKIYDVKSNWVAPYHHNSLLLTNGEIWITGGATLPKGKTQMVYNTSISRFDTNKNIFDARIAKVKERYDHAMLEYNGDVYLMGGYGKMIDNVQKEELYVEKVSMDNQTVTELPSCTYGGQSRAIVDKNGIIWKLSKRGLEMYSITKKHWSQFNIQNFIFYDSCAALKINQSFIFVFGGYDDFGEALKSSCLIDISDTNLINVTSKGEYDIPIAGGFRNNVPIIYKKHVFALQNNEDTKEEDGQRTLIKFEGRRWQLLQK